VHSTYACTALRFPGTGLDFALFDGYCRDYTAKSLSPDIKLREMLIIGDINRYAIKVADAELSDARLGPAEGSGRRWPENWLNGVFHQALSCPC
jgi:hypothetical protein